MEKQEKKKESWSPFGAIGKAVGSGVNLVGSATKAVGTGVVQGTKVSIVCVCVCVCVRVCGL